MSTVAFRHGTTFEIDRKRYMLLRKVEIDLWQAEECNSKRIHEFTDNELHRLYARRELRFSPEHVPAVIRARPRLVDLNGDQWEAAKVRRAYVMAVLDVPGSRERLTPLIKDVWHKIQKPDRCPHVASVLRWKSRFLKAGRDIRSLIQHDDRKGNTKPRFPEETVQFVKVAISKKYLCSERGTIEDTLIYAKSLVQRENTLRVEAMKLPFPTRRLVRRMINEIPAFDRHVARYGRTAAVKEFRAVLGHRLSEAPLARAEIDHTLLDVMVIDEVTGLPLGRPYVTLCIDDYTRCVLGIFISFEPPSYFTVARCLKHILLPKATLREEFPSITNEWFAHGVICVLVVDNGREFHSESLENACLSLGIEIDYAPRKQAWFKGKIERHLGTLNREVSHTTPGTTFHNIFEKGDYDPSKHAVVRYGVLKEVIYKWICDVYHQKPHRALNMSPAAMWASSITPEDILVPEDPEMLDAILGHSEQRTLTHKGVELNTLFYNSVELQDLRKKHGSKLDVEVRVDAADLGSIIVFSPDKRQMFKVPAIDQKYAAGLTLWQHRVVKRFAALELKKHDVSGWLEAKAQIADMIESELRHMKLGSRKKIARFMGEERLMGKDEPVEAKHSRGQRVSKDASALPDVVELQPLPTIAGSQAITAEPAIGGQVTAPSTLPATKKVFKFTYRERAAESFAESDE